MLPATRPHFNLLVWHALAAPRPCTANDFLLMLAAGECRWQIKIRPLDEQRKWQNWAIVAYQSAAWKQLDARCVTAASAPGEQHQTTLRCAQAEAKRLRAANGELSARLETAQQRLELAVARSGAPGAAAARQLPPAGGGRPSPPEAGGSAEQRAGGPNEKRARVAQQLFMQSAPSTPNQAPRRPPLRAPKGGAAVCAPLPFSRIQHPAAAVEPAYPCWRFCGADR